MRSLSSWSDGSSRRSGDAASAAAAIGRLAGDERLAAIFKQMREIAGMSQSEMARRLGTDVSTLLDFESGSVSALPPWPETVRIVDRYAELSQIDPSPILSRLLQLQPTVTEANAPRPVVPTRPQPRAPVQALPGNRETRPQTRLAPTSARPTVSIPPAPERRAYDVRNPSTAATGAMAAPAEPAQEAIPVGFDSRSRERETTVRTARQSLAAASGAEDPAASAARRRRRQRRTALVAAPLLTVVLLFAGMMFAPRPFYRVTKYLPSAVAMPVLAMLDAAVTQTATVKDGLRWIELGDPRLRKGDRLSR